MTKCSIRARVPFWLLVAGSLLLMTTLAAAEPRQFVAKTNLTLITAKSVRGHARTPIALKISAPTTVNGEEVILLLRNVPEHAGLNLGVNVGAGGWLIPASRVRQLTLIACRQGVFLIEVQLLNEDLKSIGAPNRFTVTVTSENAGLIGKAFE
jgi:hypothetical protein